MRHGRLALGLEPSHRRHVIARRESTAPRINPSALTGRVVDQCSVDKKCWRLGSGSPQSRGLWHIKGLTR